jgi:hypothetical protein
VRIFIFEQMCVLLISLMSLNLDQTDINLPFKKSGFILSSLCSLAASVVTLEHLKCHFRLP